MEDMGEISPYFLYFYKIYKDVENDNKTGIGKRTFLPRTEIGGR